MMIPPLKYKKSSGKEELRIKREVKHPESPMLLDLKKLGDGMAPGYTKKIGTADSRMLFVISGGSRREDDYFHILKSEYATHRLVYAFMSIKNQGLKPTEMWHMARRYKKNKWFVTETGVRYRIEAGDRLFLLQDVDEFEEEIRGIWEHTQLRNVQWVISNPCFEMWLYYHYKDTPHPMLDAMEKMDVKGRSKWLKTELNKIIPGGVQTTKILENVRRAIENSRANYAETNQLPTLYATQMDRVGTFVLDAMKEDFDRMFAEKRAQAQAWMEAAKGKVIDSSHKLSEKERELILKLGRWAHSNPLVLPVEGIGTGKNTPEMVVKAFPVTYAIPKEELDDGPTEMVDNTDELYMENIRMQIERYYYSQFMFRGGTVNKEVSAWALDSICEEAKRRGLAVLSLNRIAGVEPTWVVMNRDYLPVAETKIYEGKNMEFAEVDVKNHIYSNIHNMQDLGDRYGLSVMQVVRFRLPKKEDFRFIKLLLNTKETEDVVLTEEEWNSIK